MIDREALLALAERCEQATGADALTRLDLLEMFRSAYPRAAFASGKASDAARNRFIWLWENGATLDAALTLVPEGHDTQVHLYAGREGEGAVIVTPSKRIGLPRVFAATPALALCAAALKAHASTLPVTVPEGT